jgi:hypothetical protein
MGDSLGPNGQELEILAVSYDRIVVAPLTEPPGAESTPAAATSPQRR